MLVLEKLAGAMSSGRQPTPVCLHPLDLKVRDGSFLIAAGAAGCGKSVLIDLLAGLLPPAGGSIRFDEQDVTRWPEARRAPLVARIDCIPEHGLALELTVGENLALARPRSWFMGVFPLLTSRNRRELQATLELASGWRLAARIDEPAHRLSPGERQVLRLLMCLQRRPRILLLDDPAAALDAHEAERFLELMAQWIGEQQQTAILATAALPLALRLGDRLLLLYQGRLVEDIPLSIKKHLRVEDLCDKFEEIRRWESIDAATALVLENLYI